MSNNIIDPENNIITVKKLRRFWTNIQPIIANPYDNIDSSYGAGAHNSLYRGKFLGTSVTDEQWAAIRNGSFKDMFIGDYWTIGGIDYVICDFDYYIYCGNVNITQHHIVIMPRTGMTIPAGTPLYGTSQTLTFLSGESPTAFKWNSTNSTDGGYKYSRMRTVVMKAANTVIINAFEAAHVLPIPVMYPNPSSSTSSGLASSWAWFNNDQSNINSASICDLCNEMQIYGQQIWGLGSAYTNVGYEVGVDKFQLSIFALDRNFTNIRSNWWLRSVNTSSYTSCVYIDGAATSSQPTYAYAIRPRFVLVG